MTTSTLSLNTALGTVTVEQRDNGYCYWQTAGMASDAWSGPICESPSAWPTDNINEAAALLREALS